MQACSLIVSCKHPSYKLQFTTFTMPTGQVPHQQSLLYVYACSTKRWKTFSHPKRQQTQDCHSADVHALDSVINERTLTLCCNATYACPLPSPAHSLLQAMLTLSPFKRSCRPTRGHLRSHRDSEQTALYSASPHQQPDEPYPTVCTRACVVCPPANVQLTLFHLCYNLHQK